VANDTVGKGVLKFIAPGGEGCEDGDRDAKVQQ
jgi:hypothetical protein